MQAPFIGREDKLESLREAFELTRQGRGQIVTIAGEDGIGKSRLLEEFVRLQPTAADLLLRADCLPEPCSAPFAPMLNLLGSYFGFRPQDDQRERRACIENKVLALDRGLEETLPALYGLLGTGNATPSIAPIDAPLRRQRTLDAVARLLFRESREYDAVVFALEDLHWIDDATQALLDRLADELDGHSLMLVATYRPSCRHTWSGKPYYRCLQLESLPAAQADELARALFDDASNEANLGVLRAIVEQSRGNPLFIEEALHALAAEGTLAGEPGSYRRPSEIAEDRQHHPLRVPANIDDALSSRIDRLSSDERALLQALSVLRRPFRHALAAGLSDRAERAVSPILKRLEEAQFLLRQDNDEATSYRFRHGLYADAAYRTVLPETRTRLHRAAAAAIERDADSRLENHYFELARHYSAAEHAAKAVEYSLLAGQQAIERAAYEEAISEFNRGLGLLAGRSEDAERDQDELLLQTALGSALIGTRGWASSQVEAAFTRACQICRRQEDPSRLFAALWGLAFLYFVRGQMEQACALGNEAREVAQASRDIGLLLQAQRLIGFNQTFLGELERANEYFDETIRLFDPSRHAWLLSAYPLHPTVVARMVKGLNLWYLGYPDQALTVSSEAIWIAEDAADPFSLVNATLYVAFVLFARGDADEAMAMAESGAIIAEEHGFREYRAYSAAQLGQALLFQGHIGDGISRLRRAITVLGAMGVRFIVDYWLIVLAEAYGMQGTPERGLELTVETEQIIEETGIRLNESRLYRAKGDLLAISGADATKVERCYQQALDIARRQKNKSYELQASTQLARLWQDQGMTAQARELLSAVYGWFREGFDTADLKRARALLEQLG